MRRTLFLVWLAVSVFWMLLVGWYANETWPHLSLDLSHVDPDTQAAYQSAVLMHVLKYALIAFAAPLVVLVFGRVFLKDR